MPEFRIVSSSSALWPVGKFSRQAATAGVRESSLHGSRRAGHIRHDEANFLCTRSKKIDQLLSAFRGAHRKTGLRRTAERQASFIVVGDEHHPEPRPSGIFSTQAWRRNHSLRPETEPTFASGSLMIDGARWLRTCLHDSQACRGRGFWSKRTRIEDAARTVAHAAARVGHSQTHVPAASGHQVRFTQVTRSRAIVGDPVIWRACHRSRRQR